LLLPIEELIAAIRGLGPKVAIEIPLKARRLGVQRITVAPNGITIGWG